MSENRPVDRLAQVLESYAAHAIPDSVDVWPVVSSRLGLAAQGPPVKAKEQARPAVGGRPRRQPLTLALAATVLAAAVVAVSAYLVVRPRTASDALATPAAIPTAVPSSEIESALEMFSSIGQFSGAVLVSRGEDVLFSTGYGMADYERGIPNTPQTIYAIGAWFGEIFRGIAAMRLQEKGLLEVDQPVAKYLPDYAIDERVTVHHLLSHTSGLPDPFASLRPSETLSPEEMLAVLRKLLPLTIKEVID